jgi:hypothetical protein
MASVTIARPAPSEYAQFYHGYVSAVPDGDLIELLASQKRETAALLKGIDETKSRHRYAPGKWTIREVVGHLADAERVFTYRALRFARGDATPLASFDENAWAEASNAGSRSLADLASDLAVVRAATLGLLGGFSDAEFARSGIASGKPVTVRALAYITAGHERHHVRVLHERYGV